MAYTPELNNNQSCTLRRIAWALGVPMTTAMNVMIESFSNQIGSKKVCKSCKDKSRCYICTFNKKG